MADIPMYGSKKLDTIREKIDELDNSIHDLLMERADLALSIAEEKKARSIQIVQPAREARMIRRLIGRHAGPLPQEAVVRIWRELVGAVSLLQTGLSVVVCGSETDHYYWDIAKDYFGSVLPMKKNGSALASIGMVREDEVSFAVVPWPQDEDPNPWWSYLLDTGSGAMRIVQRLPFGDRDNGQQSNYPALVVSKSAFISSDDDHAFLLADLNANISRARIIDKLAQFKLNALNLYVRKNPAHADRTTHLIEVDSYIDPNSDQIEKIESLFDDDQARIVCCGGYPVPPVYEL